MNIMELDEAEGLTREMAEAYLNKAGWCNMLDPDIRLLKPSYVHLSFKMGLGAAVERLAYVEGRSPQSILREMNPRMRNGAPSAADLAAHAGPWMALEGPTFAPMIVDGRNGSLGLPPSTLDRWSFWPCDAHGNKVRWPAVSDAT